MSQQIRIFLILIRLLIAQSSQYVTVTPGKRGGGGGGGGGQRPDHKWSWLYKLKGNLYK